MYMYTFFVIGLRYYSTLTSRSERKPLREVGPRTMTRGRGPTGDIFAVASTWFPSADIPLCTSIQGSFKKYIFYISIQTFLIILMDRAACDVCFVTCAPSRYP